MWRSKNFHTLIYNQYNKKLKKNLIQDMASTNLLLTFTKHIRGSIIKNKKEEEETNKQENRGHNVLIAYNTFALSMFKI